MPKGIADGALNYILRARGHLRARACHGDLVASVLDELITEFIGLTGGGPAAVGATRTYHEPTITPTAAANAPGQAPDLASIGSTLVAQFTVDTDAAYRIFKIPANYVSDPAFHIHWTKQEGVGGNGNEQGNAVRWRVSYDVWPGSGQDVNVAPTVVEVEDTYDDDGTTTRIMHRTPDIALAGFQANYYVGMRVEAVTPTGSAMGAEPALANLDLTFVEEINR